MNTTVHRKGRVEDHRLASGKGRYTDDLAVEGALWSVFLRSPHARARITGIDTSDAAGMPGVVAVFTAADLAADGVGPVQADMALAGPDGRTWAHTPRPLLAEGEARFVGEPLAMVIATTRDAALDAAEAVMADLEDLDPVVTLSDARAKGAPLVHADRPGNIGADWARGDWDKAGEALAASAHRVTLSGPISRVTAATLEPRNAVARPEPGGRIALYASHQNPPALRGALATAFGMDAAQIRVVGGDVGGAFGMKAGPTREEMLCFWAAKRLMRPVRWRADRGEAMQADEGGRAIDFRAELGLDADGRFTTLTVQIDVDMGAYATGRSLPMVMNLGGVAGVYTTPVIAGRVTGYLTNTVPVGAYRGAGRPEATYIIEMLIDRAARQLGIDRIELRRRNLIRPEQMPWEPVWYFGYDSGSFEEVLDAGIDRADLSGFDSRRAKSAARGRVRGLGLALCIETAGGMWGRRGVDYTNVALNADGSISIAAGAFSAGQGVETALIDLAAEGLEIAPDRITYAQGDTDVIARGGGMGGSGAMIKCGSALQGAVQTLLADAKALAGEELEADVADIEYSGGTFRIAGTDREITLEAIAQVAGEKGVPLAAQGEFSPEAPTFPNGCHVCEVELDPETGRFEVLSYTGVEDIGRVLQPQIAEGQVQGGVAQALGQVFMEEIRYGEGDGQLLTGSFMDYAMPRAKDLPNYDCSFFTVPTGQNPLGVKGVGEAGSVGGMAAGMSAVMDALAQLGVTDFAMPASPGRVWAAIEAAK
ncbi:xanthine dehydrogenase family protein molybdopterin-binding subunit [Pseudooceanicola nitratireducens]|uniref:xanthine dehydrogenase family protein molybdopterin-binding subunit n=1 Tax=Pseudooceanicola nitratireducens TaxID=517719 RepID=UPI001C97F14D|nr:xanthine dehydrogenase family protein molybdopterin-binding subunit [Pseudooceanicola nitratireducens]MBY6165547.1 xanthine dehydrogenase family protein molybdopterin-binding subunit [Pseudooceanicola nitratireducens]